MPNTTVDYENGSPILKYDLLEGSQGDCWKAREVSGGAGLDIKGNGVVGMPMGMAKQAGHDAGMTMMLE